MKILNKKNKTYPKNNIMSYGVTIIKKDTIKKVGDYYTYDAYYFNSLNEYNSWLLEQKKNIEIQNLQQENKQLEDRLKVLETIPNLPDRISENEENIAVTNHTLNDLLSEVIPSLLTGI